MAFLLPRCTCPAGAGQICGAIKKPFLSATKKAFPRSGRQDSNLRPSGPKPDALPACATSRFRSDPRVSVATPIGFEPMTYCLEGSCSIQLSYGVKRGAKILFFWLFLCVNERIALIILKKVVKPRFEAPPHRDTQGRSRTGHS